MAEEQEKDQNAVIRGILESMVAGELPPRGVSADNVAQLLAAAIAQAGQSIMNLQRDSQSREYVHQDEQVSALESECSDSETSLNVNPGDTTLPEETDQSLQLDDTEVLSTVEVPTTEKRRMLCIKFPIELRRQIIALRKQGKRCKDIAKELKVSVSGVRKVWERFLATGMVHDRKPSTYAGRPRKYPVTPSFEIQYTSESPLNTESTHIEYVTISQEDGGENPPISTAITTVSEDGTVFVEGPLDMPGATVEIVETDHQPILTPKGGNKSRIEAPAYREQLLLRLIEDCPLSVLCNDASKGDSPHILNLESISKRPLYMEYVFGHPFGKVPASKPFEADVAEAKIICSDPADPLGKDMLAALGYSTKVYFNMCCKPSPLFDIDKVLTYLPFSLGPGYITETIQLVFQLLINLCKDPVIGLEKLPRGNGLNLIATSADGIVTTSTFPVPDKLSTYWSLLYECASLLECCENFMSASPPSAPCLICHPFEKLAMQLEIKEPLDEAIYTTSPALPEVSSIHRDTAQSTLSLTASSHGSSDLDLGPSPDMSNQEKGKGRERKRECPRRTVPPQDKVEFDGQFDVSLAANNDNVAGVESIPVSTPSTASVTFESQQVPLVQTSPNVFHTLPSVTSHISSTNVFHMSPSVTSHVSSTSPPVTSHISSTSPLKSQTLLAASFTSQSPSITTHIVPQSPSTSTKQLMSQFPLTTQLKSQSSMTTSPQLVPQATSTGDSISSMTSGYVGSCSHLQQAPLIIHRNRSPNVSQVGLPPLTMAALNVGQQDALSGLQEILVLHEESRPNGANNVEHTQGSPHVDSSNGSISQSIRRSPRKRTPQMVKSFPLADDTEVSTHQLSLMPKKKRKQKLTELSPSQNDDTLTSSSIYPLRGRKTRCLNVTASVPMNEDDKHPVEWSVEDVVEFISNIPRCSYELTFKEHEVDGESLLSLNAEMMVKLMGLKTGPALRIHKKIADLKKQFGTDY